MKVCYINYYNPLMIHGGAERVVLQEAEMIAQSGNEVIIITAHSAKRYRTAILKNGKIKVWFIPHKLPFNRGPLIYKGITLLLSLYNPLLVTHVNRILKMERPDIVHIHTYGPMSFSVIKAAKRLGCKVIQTFHLYHFECPKGSLYKRSGVICNNPLPLCRIYKVIYRQTISNCDALIAICPYVKKRLIKAGYSPDMISVIPNSFRDVRARAGTFVARPNRKEILFVGRMVKAKGVHILIKALAKVEATYNKRFDVNFIGDGEHKVYFEALAQSSGIPVNFLGKVSERVLEEHYKKAYLIVVPSLFPELFGLVILEAMSHGKPVIASRIGGVPDLVLHGQTGFLFEPNNADALAKYIQILLDDERLTIRMGDKALKASKEYSGRNHLEQLLNLYKHV